MRLYKIVLIVAVILLVVVGGIYYIATDFDRNYDKYKVRYSCKTCIESKYCPDDFKDRCINPPNRSIVSLMGTNIKRNVT